MGSFPRERISREMALARRANSPALKGSSVDDGDRVLTERVTYWFRGPRRWEVATIRRADGVQITA